LVSRKKGKGEDEWEGMFFLREGGGGKDPNVRFVDSSVRSICTYSNLGDDMNSRFGLSYKDSYLFQA